MRDISGEEVGVAVVRGVVEKGRLYVFLVVIVLN